MRLFLSLLAFLVSCLPLRAGDVTVALASNIYEPMQEIAGMFEAETGHDVALVNGSTGKLYAQILRGAPFDLFLAADQARPSRLFDAGATLGPPRTYATGQLALWSRDPGRILTAQTLERGAFRRLAIAEPELAPYGAAAREVLRALGLWEALSPKLVMGENIGQTFAFVATGNAELGLVALSYVRSPSNAGPKTAWVVPAQLHTPIRQDMVLLPRAADNAAAKAFADYLGGKTAKDILKRFGYLSGDD